VLNLPQVLIPLALAVIIGAVLVVTMVFRRNGRDRDKDGWVQPIPAFSVGGAAGSDVCVVATEVLSALDRLAGFAARRFVAVDHAVHPALVAAMSPAVLREALTEVLADAIRSAAGGQVLVTGLRCGRRVVIAISDDGPIEEDARREIALRHVGELLARHGGALSIEYHHTDGATVTVRLPTPPAVVIPPVKIRPPIAVPPRPVPEPVP